MRKYLLPEKGNFYKANLHCHSTWSDGAHTPAELKELYKARGYSVLSITDHDALFSHYELDDDEFITITGFEIEKNEHIDKNFNYCATTHICAYAFDKENFRQPGFDKNIQAPWIKWINDPEKRALIRPLGEPFADSHSPENINHIMRTLRENGFIVTYNHPAWSLENYPMYSKYTEMDNLEIYNHGCYIAGYNDHNGHVYDELLHLQEESGRKNGRKLFCVAADDNHRSINGDHHDMFGGFTMFRAEKLSYDSIMNAFKNGDFYASTGPEIKSLYAEDGKLFVETASPAESIRLITGNRCAHCCYNDDGTPINRAEFDIHPDSGYVRVEVIDGSKKAYSNAYFTDELPF